MVWRNEIQKIYEVHIFRHSFIVNTPVGFVDLVLGVHLPISVDKVFERDGRGLLDKHLDVAHRQQLQEKDRIVLVALDREQEVLRLLDGLRVGAERALEVVRQPLEIGVVHLHLVRIAEVAREHKVEKFHEVTGLQSITG